MKITGGNHLTNIDAYVKNIRDKKTVDTSSDRALGEVISKDEVVLSPEAKEIQRAKAQLDSIPDIREEKVAEIKAKIEDGTYEINGEGIALKMIEESLINELL